MGGREWEQMEDEVIQDHVLALAGVESMPEEARVVLAVIPWFRKVWV